MHAIPMVLTTSHTHSAVMLSDHHSISHSDIDLSYATAMHVIKRQKAKHTVSSNLFLLLPEENVLIQVLTLEVRPF